MSTGIAPMMPSARPLMSCIPASITRGRFSTSVPAMSITVSTMDGISVGSIPPMPDTSEAISIPAPTSTGRLFKMPSPSRVTIWIAASIISGELSSSPWPSAPSSCIPASIAVGSISTIMPRPSLRMLPRAPIAPVRPPSWNASESFVTESVPNCVNCRRDGVSPSEITI